VRSSALLGVFALGLAGCATGEGSGSVRSDRLYVKNCWDGPFDLLPDFFATVPFNDSQQIRIQRGDRSVEVSDGIILVVNDIAKIRSTQLGAPLALGLPVGVQPPGFPPRIQLVPPEVSLSLYLYATCHLQNGALNSVSGTITFDHLFSGDRNENNAEERLTQAHFDALVADPRDATVLPSPSPGAAPTADGGADSGALTDAGVAAASDAGTVITYGGSVTVEFAVHQTSHVTGDFQFYFQRGQPAQPFP